MKSMLTTILFGLASITLPANALLAETPSCPPVDHQISSSGTDTVQYYHGVVHYTDLTGAGHAPADSEIVLKRSLLPAQKQYVETATMTDVRTQKIDDETTVILVRGNTAIPQAPGIVGTGFMLGTPWAWTYTNMTMAVVPTGTQVKDINYFTPAQLIARKEVDDPTGKPSLLWESDLTMVDEATYCADYQRMYAP